MTLNDINTTNPDSKSHFGFFNDQSDPSSTSRPDNQHDSFDWGTPCHSYDNLSATSSTAQLVSPISNAADSFNMLAGQSPHFSNTTMNPAFGYANLPPSSFSSHSGHNRASYPNQSNDTGYLDGMNQSYTHDPQKYQFSFDGSSAAFMEAAREMFSGVDLTNMASRQGLYTSAQNPTSASTQALFQSVGHEVPNNVKTATRSPSPLYEIDETSSPELTEVATMRQRSFSVSDSPLRFDIPKRFSLGGSGKVGRRLSTSALDPEEKAMRAAMAEGLSKGDKRRMQNKLAQRAFRARNKVVNKQAAGRLEELESLTEQQANRISTLNDLVGRLQRENQGLKTEKFNQAMNIRPA